VIPPESIVVLTGAGVSAESGLSTFRDRGGIWSKVDWREVATPEGFARDPRKVHDFYNQRRRNLATVAPNAAHDALARLEREFPGSFLLVTQNIDDLHEKAGSRKLIHMHGELARALCSNCGSSRAWRDELGDETECGSCRRPGGLRPDVVWFGEIPYRMDEVQKALSSCDLFVSIGTSGTVYPAAGFVAEARARGARTVELNLEPSDGLFDEARHGPATRIVPEFVEEILSGGRIGR
jgi:NAD-dependent deacetylase